LLFLFGYSRPGDHAKGPQKQTKKDAGGRPKEPKKDDSDSAFKGLLISGPPGIGKTTAINVVAQEAGYEVLEFNASDTRSKKSLHEEVSDLIGNRGISEFFRPESADQHPLVHRKIVLVMEEVDGMSGSDRGGIGELVKLIQNTKIPIVCVCNDSASPKMRPLLKCVTHLKFFRPDIRLIRDKMQLIADKEGLHIEGPAMEQMISGCGNDVRQIITMMSCFRLGSQKMTYDQSKHL
jgi:replication factor C subunit 1